MSVIVFPRLRRHSLSCAGKLLLGALLLLLTIAACLGATVVGSGGGVKGIVQRKGDKAAEDFETADSDVVQITTENYTETVRTSGSPATYLTAEQKFVLVTHTFSTAANAQTRS